MTLMETIPFIVIKRPLSGRSEKRALESFLALKISDAYTFSPEKDCYLHDTLQPIFFYKKPALRISSTEIRKRLKSGRPVKTMLPDAVEQFIKKEGLYQ